MANYYVKNGGNNANTGLDDDQAWETIAKVNGFTFASGDTISFKCGSTWRETLTVPQSGSVGGYMIFNSYSTGDKPKIYGSTQATTWTAEGHTNIWQSATSLTVSPYGSLGCDIWFIETNGDISWGEHKTYTSDFSNLVNEYDFTWNANTLYIWCIGDPDTEYTAIEAPQRGNIIYLNDKQYIKIDGFELCYGVAGVNERYPTQDYTGLTISNNEIHHLGAKGPDERGYGTYVCYNDMLIEHNTIHDCGRRGLSICNYGTADISNIIIQYNVFYNGSHTTGIDIMSGSIGGATGDIDNIVARNNLIYDGEFDDISYTVAVSNWIATKAWDIGRISKLYFYNNIVKYAQAAGLALMGVHEAYVYNNTFYGINKNKTENVSLVSFTGDCENAHLKNNIYYNDGDYDLINTSMNIWIATPTTHNNIESDYNLYYSIDNRQDIVRENDYLHGYQMDDWANLKVDFVWENNSPAPTDPLFMSENDYHLQLGSPAIGAGVYLNGLVDTDYEGNTRNNPPSIGAYEYAFTDVAIGGKVHKFSTNG